MSNNQTINKKDLLQKLEKELFRVNSPNELKVFQNRYLGKEGIIKKLLKEIKNLNLEEKKDKAPLIQELQKMVLRLLKEKELELKKVQLEKELAKQAESIGYFIPKIGHLHPITQTIRALNRLFIGMGYSIVDGPEIETDEFCFQRLNVPENHPARELQDSIYIQKPNILLRTQLSSAEARVLRKYKPPFKVVLSGKIYRNEKVNKSNHFVFHHYQGVVVMKEISLKDLFGTINFLFKSLYGPDTKVRFRYKYYPEVGGGVGSDMRCFNCQGRGCSLCKGSGWIEMGGAGIIHSNVLEMAGIDSKKWKGFAFGLGLDRWAMAKYNITDIRTLFDGNLGYKYYENESII